MTSSPRKHKKSTSARAGRTHVVEPVSMTCQGVELDQRDVPDVAARRRITNAARGDDLKLRVGRIEILRTCAMSCERSTRSKERDFVLKESDAKVVDDATVPRKARRTRQDGVSRVGVRNERE